MTAAGLIDPPPVLAPTVDRVTLVDPVFISDLHLSADHPRTLQAFERFVRESAPRFAELLILGDLFEAWVGDDDLDEPAAQAVCAALAALSGRGVRLFIMHGNRDLLLGRGFAQRVGATLLADPTIATIADRSVLLAHGDAYCTLDEPYQRFRAQTHDANFQRNFLSQPLPARRAYVAQARAQSQQHKRMEAADIMDVTPQAIESALRTAASRLIVHGHTHRPAMHDLLVDETAARRVVLTDWDFDVDPPRGGYLRFIGSEPVAEVL